MKNDIIIIHLSKSMEFSIYPRNIYEDEETNKDSLIKDIVHYIGDYVVRTFIFHKNKENWVSHWEKKLNVEDEYSLIYENNVDNVITYYHHLSHGSIETLNKIDQYLY